MMEHNCEDNIPNLKEHDIDDEQFWGLEDGDMSGLLEISIYGRRKKLMKAMADIKKAHEKEAEKLFKLKKKINKDGISDLLKTIEN